MANVTLVFAVLLAGLGVGGYVGTGSSHPTALIPLWFGLALGVFGFLAMSPDEGRRKLFMHINVTIGLLGFLGTLGEIGRTFLSGKEVDLPAMGAKLGLAWLLLFYVILCAWSFAAARRAKAIAAMRKEVAVPPAAKVAPPAVTAAPAAVAATPVAVVAVPPAKKE
jgi:hypothetical protein